MQMDDFKWFVSNCQQLFEQYGLCYLAIHNKSVVGVFNSVKEAVDVTKQTVPMGEFIVQLCTGDEAGYTNYISSMHFC